MAHILIVAGFADSLINFRGVLIEEMISNGHQVTACAPNASINIQKRLVEIGAQYCPLKLSRAGFNPIADLASFLRLRAICKSERPDVIISYTIKAVIYSSLAARSTGVTRIFSIITGLGYAFTTTTIKSRIAGIFARLLYKLAINYNNHIFFQNPDDILFFKHHGLLKNTKEKAVLINGSGIDINEFTPTPFPELPSFLLIARLISDKGIREYVEAAQIIKKKHPSIKFRVAGWLDKNPNSISPDELEKWVNAGTIDYLGKLPDVRPAISDSSVYVLPSYYPEGTPRTILEAMAMGRPIITTDSPGCRETVTEGVNGFMVPVRDSKSLADAILKFIREPELIKIMGQSSHRMALEKYDVHKVNRVILDTMRLI